MKFWHTKDCVFNDDCFHIFSFLLFEIRCFANTYELNNSINKYFNNSKTLE